MSDDQLYDLVIEWDQRRQLGEEVDADVLCQDQPELVEELKARIASVRATDWMFEPDDDEDDDFLSVPDFAGIPKNSDETQLPSTTLTVEEFTQAVADRGLMAAEEVEDYRQASSASDAESLARELISISRLTPYQATVLLAERSDPLLLDRYLVLDAIDSGGMGLVFKALHRSLDRVVALKTLPPSAADSEEKVKRFRREAKNAAMLSHPNIVTTHDAHESNGVYFLVMEYVPGKDLGKSVKQSGPLPVAEAVDYVIQAAKGLEYAHSQGIVHRDIKPGNLVLDADGTVKVLDLGLARLDTSNGTTATTEEELTSSHGVMGTASYMSPEQAANTHDVDARSDIYSLGCTLYFLLTGRPPYKEGTFLNTVLAHRDKPIPPLETQRHDVPEELVAVYRRMLAKNPEGRYQSMTEVIAALSGPAAGKQVIIDTSSRDPSLTVERKPLPTRKGAPRRWWMIGSMATLLLVAGVVLTVVFKIITAAGTLIVEVNEPDAEVQVDGSKIKITTSKDGQRVKIRVKEGIHTLTVTKGGFQTFTKEVVVKSGGVVTIKVRLEPPRTSVTSKITPKPSSSPAELPSKPSDPPPAIAPFDADQAKQHQQAWAEYLGLPVEREIDLGEGTKMTFVLIPPGEFLMGSTAEEQARFLEDARADGDPWTIDRIPSEGPQHRVRITKPFAVSRHEVTRGQFRQFVEETGYKTYAEQDGIGGVGFLDGKHVRDPRFIWSAYLGFPHTDDHPVVNVSWNDARAFCKWLSKKQGVKYDLPTEAQWEYACRAGTTTFWHCGDSDTTLYECAWFFGNSGARIHPVAQLKPNAWGLYDMHGNVWDWCADWYGADYYTQALPSDPSGPTAGQRRVCRGGGWHRWAPCCRSAYRHMMWPHHSYANLGFRVASEIVPE